MTKRTLSHIAAIFILFAALFTQVGCKENTIINTNITPAGDSLVTEGVPIAITAKTVYSHFQTNNYFAGLRVIMGVGVISSDPEVGSTNASFYMQVVPKQSAGFVLPSNIDSFVLVLPYSGFTYGDTAGALPQEYKAYMVTEDLKRDTTYYDNTSKAYNTTAIGTSGLVSLSSLDDSVAVGDLQNGKALPHLRIRLDASMITPLLQSADYSSYATFLSSFKGLHVRATTPGNTISYFRLSDNGSGDAYSKAGIVVYYHNTASPDTARSEVYGFMPDNCAFFNKIDNDITGSNAATDTVNYIFLQSRPGLSVEISTKDVKNLPNRLVNKAEIVITEVASQDESKYFAPDWLYPYKIDTTDAGTDTLVAIADAIFSSPSGTSVSGLEFIAGKVKKVMIGSTEYNQYTINVPREFQQALKEKREMTLRITGVTNGYIGAYRLRAGKNATDPAFNIRMNVVYSRVQ